MLEPLYVLRPLLLPPISDLLLGGGEEDLTPGLCSLASPTGLCSLASLYVSFLELITGRSGLLVISGLRAPLGRASLLSSLLTGLSSKLSLLYPWSFFTLI